MNTETELQLVPAGWYQDSPDPTQVRWWDGQAWTDHVQTLPTEVAHAADVESTLTRRQLREQNGSLYAGEVDINAERDAAERAQQEQVARVAAERAAAEEAAAQAAAAQAAEQTAAQAAQAELDRVEAVRVAAERFAAETAAAEEAANAPYVPPTFAAAVAEKESYVGFRDVQTMQHPKETPASARARMWNAEVDSHPMTVKHVGVQTFAVWLLAIMPVWATAAAWQVPLLQLTDDKRLPYLVVAVFTLLFSVGLAQSDRSQLRERGFDNAASPGWAVIPFLYLIIRAFRMGAGGVAPLLTFITLQAGIVLLAFNAAVPIVLAAIENAPDAAPAAIEPVPVALTGAEREFMMTADGAAQQLTSDLIETGFVPSAVECLPFPSAEVGATTTCAVTVDGADSEVHLLLTPNDPFRAFLIQDAAAVGADPESADTESVQG